MGRRPPQGDEIPMTVTLDRKVEEFIGTPRQLFIDGSWADAASGKTFETPNPATGETLARIAEGDAEDINRAVEPDFPVRARPDHLEDRRPDPGAHRGARPARVAGQRQALRGRRGRRRAAGRGPVPLYGRLGHQD